MQNPVKLDFMQQQKTFKASIIVLTNYHNYENICHIMTYLITL